MLCARLVFADVLALERRIELGAPGLDARDSRGHSVGAVPRHAIDLVAHRASGCSFPIFGVSRFFAKSDAMREKLTPRSLGTQSQFCW